MAYYHLYKEIFFSPIPSLYPKCDIHTIKVTPDDNDTSTLQVTRETRCSLIKSEIITCRRWRRQERGFHIINLHAKAVKKVKVFLAMAVSQKVFRPRR